MDRDVSMSLLVSVVFGNIMQVISSDDNGPLHFCGDTDSLEDLSSNGYVACEGAFLIDIVTFDGLFGCFESQSDVLEVSDSTGCLLC